MFELLRPDKEAVGKRIRIVKEELGVSLTELGDRLGLVKPTINSYVQGYTLAPSEVLEKLSKIAGKSIGWFYFGEIEDYIREYLLKTGYKELLSDYPEIPVKLKDEFVNSKSESWDWQNELGYPYEDSIDDIFLELYHDIMKNYITSITREYADAHFDLDNKRQEEAVNLISHGVYESFVVFGELQYGDRENIEEQIQCIYEQSVKNNNIIFEDEYLVGRLINILSDDDETVDLIGRLSQELTDKGRLNTQFGGREVVDIFQAMRPALISLYMKETRETFYDWFEK